MASIWDEVRQNPETGEIFAKTVGADHFERVSPAELAAGEEGTLTSMAKSAGANALMTAEQLTPQGQVGTIMGLLGGPEAPIAQTLRPGQDARAAVRPMETLTAEVAGDPLNLAGGGAAAGAVGRTARSLVGEAASGARGVAESVAAPARNAVGKTGDAILKANPSSVSGRVLSRIGQAGDEAAETRRLRDLSAAAADDVGPLSRVKEGIMTPDELAKFSATNPRTSDAMQVRQLTDSVGDYRQARDIDAENIARGEVGGGANMMERLLAGDVGGEQRVIMEGLQNDLNATVARELGVEDFAGMLDRRTVGARMDEISDGLTDLTGKGFREAGEKGPDLSTFRDDVTSAMDQEDMIQDPRVDRILDEVEEFIKRNTGEDGLVTPETASAARNRLVKRQAQERGSEDTVVGDALEVVIERLDAKARAGLSEADIAKERELRRQWGLARQLTDGARTVGDDGVNIRSFATARGRKMPGFRQGRGRSNDDPFDRYLRTMEELLIKPKSSGTAENAAAERRGFGALQTGVLGAGGLGVLGL